MQLQRLFYDQTYESEHIADHLRRQIGEGCRRHGWEWEWANVVSIVGSLLLSGKEMLSRGEWSGVRARVRVRKHGSCSVFTFRQDLQIRKGSFTALCYLRVVRQQQLYGEVLLDFCPTVQVLGDNIHSDLVDLRHRIHHIPDSNIS
jgi:hypothetical protein